MVINTDYESTPSGLVDFDTELLGHHKQLERWAKSMPKLRRMRIKAYFDLQEGSSVGLDEFADIVKREGYFVFLIGLDRFESFQNEDTSHFGYIRSARGLGWWSKDSWPAPGEKWNEKGEVHDNDSDFGLGPEHEEPEGFSEEKSTEGEDFKSYYDESSSDNDMDLRVGDERGKSAAVEAKVDEVQVGANGVNGTEGGEATGTITDQCNVTQDGGDAGYEGDAED